MKSSNHHSKLLRDQAYEKIKRSIIIGDYAPNSILYETTTAKSLRMSRTPVREALMRLTEDELVKNLQNNGFLVAVPTLKEIEEIFDLRLCLEKFVVEEIFEKGLRVDISEMNQIVGIQTAALKENDFWAFFEANHRFHIRLVDSANNGTITKIMQGLRDKPILSGFHALRNNAKLTDAISEHLAVIDALDHEDKDRAVAEVKRHALNAKKRLLGVDR